MAVHIRLAPSGSKKRPFYRVVVADQRSPRGGRFLEKLGIYNPQRSPIIFQINQARFAYWKSVGAQLTPTVAQLFKKCYRSMYASEASTSIERPFGKHLPSQRR
ncbi:30S ribosomal protein S16 [Pajaroellobacter abortibovis]|uniref:Small ribosomal subunit protein bS16 n=1 Tax=Pajaroellobacter abortibovis TaxID=1882918 RepID=A0A1L6MWN5_9BACT|nr:30S ribosomal protein S16 [Pajaroellobacter abortibovis]APR99969.1 30S ribosomal protein S16 [Pajaroellobacter abortibovis]